MTDAELVAKKLGLIEAYVHDLRTLGRPDDLATDIREQRFTLHTLQLAAQAALDVASHIVSDDRLGEPETGRDLFGLLARHGWIEGELAARLEDMAGFRNVLVHEYVALDLQRVVDALDELDPLERFLEIVVEMESGEGRVS